MKISHRLLSLIAMTATITLLGPFANSPCMAAAQADSQPAAAANNAFAFDLYAKFQYPTGNLFFSPYSIHSALTMTQRGAAGATADQMAKVLHLPENADALNQAYASLNTSLSEKHQDAFQLSVANALFAQQGQNFLPAFTNLVTDSFHAGLQRLDFVTAFEPARKTINAWVEKQTNDRIQDLLAPGTVTADTRLVLTNAIYFKAPWEMPFNKELTQKEDFRTPGAPAVKTPFMHYTRELAYAEDDHCQALLLPYRDHNVAMLILLPKPMPVLANQTSERMTPDPLKVGMSNLESSLNSNTYSALVAKLAQRQIALALPTWKSTQSFELGDTLKAMGMPLAFDPSQADFSNMTGTKELSLSAVVHKSFIEVDEAGTEAAAATAIMMTGAAVAPTPPPAIPFIANRPFLYFIIHQPDNTILFAGRLNDPTR